ncbi:MAG: hypothetical protein OQJ99_03815 [Rhodospirillales bacterium]|nr:hypothetical protein [Rhodospirillales bacterium]MCW8862402.1 hypothetical protein [Rhodospirillales bacterium]MCW8953280.1 hypothetical protein [Rhodospirillales bacterium]
MADHETVTLLDDIDAPWGKRVEVMNVEYEGGISLIRLRIRENKRFTIMDLDADTAARLGRTLSDWSEKNAAA